MALAQDSKQGIQFSDETRRPVAVSPTPSSVLPHWASDLSLRSVRPRMPIGEWETLPHQPELAYWFAD